MSTYNSICKLLGVPLSELITERKCDVIQVPEYCKHTGKFIRMIDVKRKSVVLSNGMEPVIGAFGDIELYDFLGEGRLDSIGWGVDRYVGLLLDDDKESIEHHAPSKEEWDKTRTWFKEVGFNPKVLNIRLFYLLRIS